MLLRTKIDLDCGGCIKECGIEVEAVFNNLLCQLLMENAVINEEAYEEDACCGRSPKDRVRSIGDMELKSHQEKKSTMQGLRLA